MDRSEATVLDYPRHSPDLVLSDFHLFPKLNEHLRGHHFVSDNKVNRPTSTVMDLRKYFKRGESV